MPAWFTVLLIAALLSLAGGCLDTADIAGDQMGAWADGRAFPQQQGGEVLASEEPETVTVTVCVERPETEERECPE